MSSFGISISTDGGEVHKEIIDFLQLEADGLILAWSLAFELSQSLLVDLFKGLLSSSQTVDMGFQMKLSQCCLVGWFLQFLEQLVLELGKVISDVGLSHPSLKNVNSDKILASSKLRITNKDEV